METFFWVCAALIVIGLPALAILGLYASLKSVKEYLETIESLKTDIYNHESNYQRLKIEKESVEISLENALQEKEYAEEKLEYYGHKHTSVVNSIHRGILDEIYSRDKTSYLSTLIQEHGGTVADYNQKDKDTIIEKFIEKYPKPINL